MWGLLAVAFALLNFKNLPFVWHVRLKNTQSPLPSRKNPKKGISGRMTNREIER